MKTKYFILTLLLQSVMIFSAYSQQLKGVQEFSKGGSNYYTKVNWTASYNITFDGDGFYINLINPTTSPSSTSLYGHDNEFYSKSDLGLTNWPNTNPSTANFTLDLTVIMPDGKADNTRYGKKDEPGYLGSIADYKGATISSFKVSSVQSMHYNGGGDGKLDILINERKYNLAAAKQNNNSSTNNSNSNSSSKNQNNTEEKSVNNNPNNGTRSQSSQSNSSQNSSSNNNSYNSNSTTNSNAQSGSITNMSEKVRTTAGDVVQSYQQNGKHYIRYEDGSSREANQETYNSVQKTSENIRINRENYEKTQAEQTKKNNEIAQDAIKKSNQWANDFNKRIDDQIARDQKSAQLAQQSYYTAEAVSNARSNVSENMSLSGNYSTPEELEAEFNAKSAALNTAISNLANAQNDNLQATFNTFSTYRNEKQEAIGQVAVGALSLINQLQVEKEQRLARERLQREKAEALAGMERKKAEMEEQKKAMKLTMRKSLFTQFPEGGLPLSSHKIPVDELYFFTYIFDNSTSESTTPKVYLSNVFPVAKYGDGTWPYKSTLIIEIKKLNRIESPTLIGYYTTKEMAEGMHDSFLRLSAQSELVVENIVYKGKPNTGSSSSTDFWGNSIERGGQKTDPEKSEPKTNNSNVDFWGNPIKTEQQKTAVETPAKQEPTKTKAKLDYWGNPIKE